MGDQCCRQYMSNREKKQPPLVLSHTSDVIDSSMRFCKSEQSTNTHQPPARLTSTPSRSLMPSSIGVGESASYGQPSCRFLKASRRFRPSVGENVSDSSNRSE